MKQVCPQEFRELVVLITYSWVYREQPSEEEHPSAWKGEIKAIVWYPKVFGIIFFGRLVWMVTKTAVPQHNHVIQHHIPIEKLIFFFSLFFTPS